MLKLTCGGFNDGDWLPLKFSGVGEDVSPEFRLSGIDSRAVSMVIACHNMEHPKLKVCCHWLIWDLPVMEVVPEHIPEGEHVESLGGATQGVAYGVHVYRGPNPPKGQNPLYQYTAFILDCKLNLSPDAHMKEVAEAMKGHILQQDSVRVKFEGVREV